MSDIKNKQTNKQKQPSCERLCSLIFWGTHKISPQCVCILTIDNSIFPTDVMECTFFFFLTKSIIAEQAADSIGGKTENSPFMG